VLLLEGRLWKDFLSVVLFLGPPPEALELEVVVINELLLALSGTLRVGFILATPVGAVAVG
jgi:hypothetical protein